RNSPAGGAVADAGGRVATSEDGPRGDQDQLRVLIVDDHALFRRGLEIVLEDEPDITVVGEASDGQEAVAKSQALMPDVVLMDVRMPRRSGIEAAREIRTMLPHVRSLMLTASEEG